MLLFRPQGLLRRIADKGLRWGIANEKQIPPDADIIAGVLIAS
jgi:hypothetical protein